MSDQITVPLLYRSIKFDAGKQGAARAYRFTAIADASNAEQARAIAELTKDPAAFLASVQAFKPCGKGGQFKVPGGAGLWSIEIGLVGAGTAADKKARPTIEAVINEVRVTAEADQAAEAEIFIRGADHSHEVETKLLKLRGSDLSVTFTKSQKEMFDKDGEAKK